MLYGGPPGTTPRPGEPSGGSSGGPAGGSSGGSWGGPSRPAGRSRPGRRWYAPAPDPPLPPISARRAYTEVLAVYLAFFAAGIVAAGVLLGGRSKDLTENGSWAVYSINAIEIVAQIGLALTLVVLLCARRGVTPAALGLGTPRAADGGVAVGQSIRIVGWCFLAIILGDIVAAFLSTGGYPRNTPNAPELVYAVFDSIQAGVIEELVVLAFVVVTLRQARRPWGEVTVVALILRGAYHIYYGPGVFGILVWAAIMYWIYLRFRQVVPMMVAHAGYDATVFLSQRWPAVALVGVLVLAGLWILCGALWLEERGRRPPAMAWPPTPPPGLLPPGLLPPGLPPPGWHPDPGGGNRWRWWDGAAWTEHVSQH